MKENRIVGRNLKALREANRYTQEQVASYLGIQRSAYANYESGEREAPIEILAKASELMGCELGLLFDENQNEYWFDTKCGFKGMESIYSEKILNLVGIREKYNIDSEKEIHETNISLNNELNILVVEINLADNIEKYFIDSFIKLNFDDAYSRYTEIENLQIFGAIKPINQAIGKDLYIDYFDDYDENIHDEYPINNILFLDKYLVNYIKSNIGESIKTLLGIKDDIYIRKIKKMEYGIYGY
jgi:transcriptional regulator with XRE-family HTH domain